MCVCTLQITWTNWSCSTNSPTLKVSRLVFMAELYHPLQPLLLWRSLLILWMSRLLMLPPRSTSLPVLLPLYMWKIRHLLLLWQRGTKMKTNIPLWKRVLLNRPIFFRGCFFKDGDSLPLTSCHSSLSNYLHSRRSCHYYINQGAALHPKLSMEKNMKLLYEVTFSTYQVASLFSLAGVSRGDDLYLDNPTKERDTWKGKYGTLEKRLSAY